MVQEGGAPELDTPVLNIPALSLPETGAKERRQAPPAMPNFEGVQKNIRNYARGIFKPPAPYRHMASQPLFPHANQQLPPRHQADRLISNFKRSIHVYAPLLHWPTFSQEYENLYRVGSFDGCRQIWVSVFYAVMATGSIMDTQPSHAHEGDGTGFLQKSINNVNTWSDELTIDHVRVALLISTYFMEVNLKSAGWVWLGSAVRISQDIGLHCDRGPYPPMDAEIRRRVWWSVYNWDRLVSLEIGRPTLINDDDCDVQEPTPVDDDCIRPNGIVMPPPGQNHPSALIAVIPVVRIISQLKKTLKSRTIAAATLSTYDEHFKTIMQSYPDPYNIHSQVYLDPRLLCAATTLQVARFFLYRHNMSSACRRAERRDALDRCVSAAKDTAQYISRSLQHQSTPSGQGYFVPTPMADWQARLRTMVPAFFCTHLWRCVLVLCMRAEYASAQICICAMAAVGDLRKVNMACGRNLVFFLDRLVERLHNPSCAPDADEELLAYASGDMQGDTDEAWAWAGGETSTKTTPTTNGVSIGKERGQPQPEPAGLLSTDEMYEWGGWDHVQRMLTHLQEEQQRGARHMQPYPPQQQHAQPQLMHLAPQSTPSHGLQSPGGYPVSPGAQSTTSTAGRISIKDIM